MNNVDLDTQAVTHIRPLPNDISPQPKIVFTDVDDTLTYKGSLPKETFVALHRLQDAGITVIPVTGASAGWCDCIIKTWPIKHMIGENGSLIVEKNENGIVSTQFTKNPETVKKDLIRLKEIGEELTTRYPDIQYTQDQAFRLTDIAFDIGQTVTVPEEQSIAATAWLNTQGVQARRSSIHINVWLGEYSKSSGALSWLDNRNISEKSCLFIGDSPNDESMFEQFSNSVGVANIDRFLAEMEFTPNYITQNPGGHGFVDLTNVLLRAN